MADRIYSLLKANRDKLQEQYDANAESIAVVQEACLSSVLPHLRAELDLGEHEAAWAEEWLRDEESIFRLLRRHNFTRSFAIEAAGSTLLWRLRFLRHVLVRSPPAFFHCLPPPAADPWGRPLVVIRVEDLRETNEGVKDAILAAVEALRAHLRWLNEMEVEGGTSGGGRGCEGILQYVLLVDLEGVSLQGFNVDFLSWVMGEIIPRYPGMLAAVFLMNYSWTHSGVWSVAKRLLPASAISRVFFPSREELTALCGPDALPQEYGGTLPPLHELENMLLPEPDSPAGATPPRSTSLTVPGSVSVPNITVSTDIGGATNQYANGEEAAIEVSSPGTLTRRSSSRALLPTSPHNPFFAYPASSSSRLPYTHRHVHPPHSPHTPHPHPHPHAYHSGGGGADAVPSAGSGPPTYYAPRHGRKRKRDLLRTLVLLWWRRWAADVGVLAFCALLLGLALRLGIKGWGRKPGGRRRVELNPAAKAAFRKAWIEWMK